MSPIHAIPHLPAWQRGPDGRHRRRRARTLADLRQGASLSIEDAVVLAKCLRDLPSPQEAFARFEQQPAPAGRADHQVGGPH